MHEGIATGAAAFEDLLTATGWQRSDIDKSICHQVGSIHRRQMLAALGLSEERDFITLDWLGNTGSAALPVTMAIAAQEGALSSGDRVAMLGIGSGINCVMLGLEWQRSLVKGAASYEGAHSTSAGDDRHTASALAP